MLSDRTGITASTLQRPGRNPFAAQSAPSERDDDDGSVADLNLTDGSSMVSARGPASHMANLPGTRDLLE